MNQNQLMQPFVGKWISWNEGPYKIVSFVKDAGTPNVEPPLLFNWNFTLDRGGRLAEYGCPLVQGKITIEKDTSFIPSHLKLKVQS